MADSHCNLCQADTKIVENNISCSAGCKNVFHKACVNISARESEIISASTNIYWYCDQCKDNVLNRPSSCKEDDALDQFEQHNTIVTTLIAIQTDLREKDILISSLIETIMPKVENSINNIESNKTLIGQGSKSEVSNKTLNKTGANITNPKNKTTMGEESTSKENPKTVNREDLIEDDITLAGQTTITTRSKSLQLETKSCRLTNRDMNNQIENRPSNVLEITLGSSLVSESNHNNHQLTKQHNQDKESSQIILKVAYPKSNAEIEPKTWAETVGLPLPQKVAVLEERTQSKIIEEARSIFELPNTTCLAHCISADYHMERGIAAEFKQKFEITEETKIQNNLAGDCAILEMENKYIYNLVTKTNFNDKPKLNDLASSVNKMITHCKQYSVKALAMPRIGCNRDGLKWEDVKKLLIEATAGMDLTITICTLPRPEGQNRVTAKKQFLSTNSQRRRETPTVTGTAETKTTFSKFAAAEKKVWIHISKVNTATSANDIIEYIQERIPGIKTTCEEIQTKSSHKSFKVSADFKHKDVMYEPKFWPQGVAFKRFSFL